MAVTYLPGRLRTHSATAVARPRMKSGTNHSADAPDVYAMIASTQQEPAIHSAIDKDSGSPPTSALP